MVLSTITSQLQGRNVGSWSEDAEEGDGEPELGAAELGDARPHRSPQEAPAHLGRNTLLLSDPGDPGWGQGRISPWEHLTIISFSFLTM